MSLKLLVTFDRSPFSEGILDAAIRTATLTQAEVFLLTVTRPAHEVVVPEARWDAVGEGQRTAFVGGPMPEARIREVETATQATDRVHNEAMDYLRLIAARFPGGAMCIVRQGSNAATAILAYADEIAPDVIAMATHGRTGLSHVVVGSVAEHVVRAGKRPVLLLRPAM